MLALRSNFIGSRWILVIGCSGSPKFVGKALSQLTRICFAAIISYQVPISRQTIDALSHSWSLLGHTSLDPLHPDFVPSIFDEVDGPSKEKLKRELKKYVQTTETKRKSSTSVACTAMEKDKTCTYASSAWIT